MIQGHLTILKRNKLREKNSRGIMQSIMPSMFFCARGATAYGADVVVIDTRRC